MRKLLWKILSLHFYYGDNSLVVSGGRKILLVVNYTFNFGMGTSNHSHNLFLSFRTTSRGWSLKIDKSKKINNIIYFTATKNTYQK